MTTTASLASADVASPDILRQIFGWIATEENLLSISKVCRNWRSALDHDSVWAVNLGFNLFGRPFLCVAQTTSNGRNYAKGAAGLARVATGLSESVHDPTPYLLLHYLLFACARPVLPLSLGLLLPCDDSADSRKQ